MEKKEYTAPAIVNVRYSATLLTPLSNYEEPGDGHQLSRRRSRKRQDWEDDEEEEE